MQPTLRLRPEHHLVVISITAVLGACDPGGSGGKADTGSTADDAASGSSDAFAPLEDAGTVGDESAGDGGVPADDAMAVSVDAGSVSSDAASADSAPCVPTGAEVCNGVDDDCNGAVDDLAGICSPPPSCAVFVAIDPAGSTLNPGTRDRPLDSLNTAIERAAAMGAGHDVCLCRGANSYASPQGILNEDVVMHEGVSVYGNFACDGWIRRAGVHTEVDALSPEGLRFPAGITSTMRLDGVTAVAWMPDEGPNLPAFVGAASAITITDASPTLVDVIALTLDWKHSFGLRASATAPGSRVTIQGGKYWSQTTLDFGTMDPNGAGGESSVGIELVGIAATIVGADIEAGYDIGYRTHGGTGSFSIGLDCHDCVATQISNAVIAASHTFDTSTGIRLSGNVDGFTTDQTQVDAISHQLSDHGYRWGTAYGLSAHACNGRATLRGGSLTADGWTWSYRVDSDCDVVLDGVQ